MTTSRLWDYFLRWRLFENVALAAINGARGVTPVHETGAGGMALVAKRAAITSGADWFLTSDWPSAHGQTSRNEQNAHDYVS